MKNLTQRWTQSQPFFRKSRHSFRFSKRAGETSPLQPTCAPASVVEYASISLNLPKYSWKCLNKLFWLCQGFECAWLSYMFYRFWRCLRISIWYSCSCKGYAEFWIFPNMAPYASIIPEYASYVLMSLNIPENGWILLNECPWICPKKLVNFNNFLFLTTVK